jgi:hypothetical protein
VFAADADPKALRATLRNAELNGVSGRVSAVGIVQSGHLHKYLRPDASLLVMDREGAEFHLAGSALRVPFASSVGSSFLAWGIVVAALAGTHELFDFSLQIPAATFVVMMVMGNAAVQSEEHALPARQR